MNATAKLQKMLEGLTSLVQQAWDSRDDIALGYPSWADFCLAEFGRDISIPARSSEFLFGSSKRGLKPDQRSVYFIQAARSGLVKIGVAEDPVTRCKNLQTASPDMLVLLLVLPGLGEAGETALHHQFATHWSHGEWFYPAPEVINFIKDRREHGVHGNTEAASAQSGRAN